MDNYKIINNLKLVAIVLVLTAIFVFAIMFFLINLDLTYRILTYSEKHQTMTLKNITKFDWDIVYLDRGNYGSGEELKTNYNLDYNFKRLKTDRVYRLAFCKKGQVVKDCIQSIDVDIEISKKEIFPDDIFLIIKDERHITLKHINN